MAKITLLGMNNYVGDSLWAMLSVPIGANKVLLEEVILERYGECETLYSNPAFMRVAIGNWSLANKYLMEKLWNSSLLEYDPIYNYDRHETRTTTPNLQRTLEETKTHDNYTEDAYDRTNTEKIDEYTARSYDRHQTTNSDLTTTTNATGNTVTRTDYGNNTYHNVSAFDTSEYSPSNEDRQTGTDTVTVAPNTTGTVRTRTTPDTKNDVRTYTDKDDTDHRYTGTGNTVNQKTNTPDKKHEYSDNPETTNLTERNTGNNKEEIRAYGNIGVTTSQQMLESERAVAYWSWYYAVAEQFAHDLIIMVY